MKFLRTYLILSLLIPLCTYASTEGLEKDYSHAKIKLENAIEKRNFSEAKHALLELMPMMKDELKASKKELATKKTELEEVELEVIKGIYHRKKEIYNRLHHLIHVSPAALRGKSSDMIPLVEEFERLAH